MGVKDIIRRNNACCVSMKGGIESWREGVSSHMSLPLAFGWFLPFPKWTLCEV